MMYGYFKSRRLHERLHGLQFFFFFYDKSGKVKFEIKENKIKEEVQDQQQNIENTVKAK